MANVLEIDAVSKAFGTKPAVRGATLSVREGELHALLGPSGCGKTTLLRLIAGFESPDDGAIRLAGETIATAQRCLPPQQRQLGMVFQDYHLFPHMTVAQNVAYGLGKRSPQRRQRVAEVLATVGLEHLAHRAPHTLSGGQQQRVAIARALAPKPRVLLLDEPFSNLDEQLRVELRARVQAILKQTRTTALLVTHHQEEAMSIADRISVISDGEILQTAAPRLLYLRPNSRTVASFVGESNFLPGVADGLTAKTALGNLAIDRPMHGECEVLLRPESIAATLDGAELGRGHVIADVVASQFFGRERLLTLEFGDPKVTLLARVGIAWPGDIGSRVAVQVKGVLSAFQNPRATTHRERSRPSTT